MVHIKITKPDGESIHHFEDTKAMSVESQLSEGMTIWLREDQADSEVERSSKWCYLPYFS